MLERDAVYVMYGNQPRAMVREVLERMGLSSHLKTSMKVGLKPNLVVPKPSSSGATTSAELVEGVIEYLKGNGIHRIVILESSGVGHDTSEAYRMSGMESVSHRHGVELVDLKGGATETIRYGSFGTKVFKKAREIDYLINLPVVKVHCQTRITCALKNLKGLIPDDEKRRFHTIGLHQPVAYLSKVITQNLVIADGIMGDLTFEEGGTPVPMNRILVARDPVLIDSYVCDTLGYRVKEVQHLSLAMSLGVGNGDRQKARIVELNKASCTSKVIKANGALASLASLARMIEDREACSVCYGSLIHALQRIKGKGRLSSILEPLHIGQGYKGSGGKGIGIGHCTEGFSSRLPGCPPQAVDIVHFLEKLTERLHLGRRN